MDSLSPQEQRILDHISEGMTNKQIAESMFLAEHTVKNYVTDYSASSRCRAAPKLRSTRQNKRRKARKQAQARKTPRRPVEQPNPAQINDRNLVARQQATPRSCQARRRRAPLPIASDRQRQRVLTPRPSYLLGPGRLLSLCRDTVRVAQHPHLAATPVSPSQCPAQPGAFRCASAPPWDRQRSSHAHRSRARCKWRSAHGPYAISAASAAYADAHWEGRRLELVATENRILDEFGPSQIGNPFIEGARENLDVHIHDSQSAVTISAAT